MDEKNRKLEEALKKYEMTMDLYEKLANGWYEKPASKVTSAPAVPARRDSVEPLIPADGAAYLQQWFDK